MNLKFDRTEGLDKAVAASVELGCSYIMLGKGKFALVDNSEVERLICQFWHVSVVGYAVTFFKKKAVLMHRIVFGAAPWEVMDHINLDRLDNRRSNLRICDSTQNNANRNQRKDARGSKFKGVSLDKRDGIYYAVGTNRGKHSYLGRFEKETDAARAYDSWALSAFGEFARINGV